MNAVCYKQNFELSEGSGFTAEEVLLIIFYTYLETSFSVLKYRILINNFFEP